MAQSNSLPTLPESGYMVFCTAGGRVLLCTDSFRALMGEALEGRNLNDFLEDADAARIIAAAQSGGGLDFECMLRGKRFSGFAEGAGEHIGVRFYPAEPDGTPSLSAHSAGLIGREMNNALHAMFLALSQIRPQLIGEAREDAEVLSQNLYKLLRLSHNLSDCADAENGLLRLRVSEEDAVELCGALAARMREPCRRRGITLRWEPPEGPILFRVDREKVERMILNLVSNAIAAQKSGGEITLLLEERDEEVAIAVIDAGAGLPDGGSELFCKYRTANPAEADSVGGAGFGLALTVAFAKLHGGQVFYSGGGGTAFHILLPKNLQGPTAPLAAWAQDYSGGVDRVLLELSTVLTKENY